MTFSELTLRGMTFRPALFCAPLVGITHSAFRRLVAEYGGCGGFWTEMLAAKQILREDLHNSPYLRRRAIEPHVIYQLMVIGTDNLERVIERLAEIKPDGIDINLACHAPVIRNLAAGSGLFENAAVLADVLRVARQSWPGLLTVKIRFGRDADGWEARFAERLRIIEDGGVDAITLHPRFFEDKFKRRARHELYAWAASLTRLPLIANGDITGPTTIRENAKLFEPCRGAMIGRMAAAQPWIFAAWEKPMPIDHPEVWRRMVAYICEDFTPEQTPLRVKMFTKYFARNFKFGHSLFTPIQNVCSLDAIREHVESFFSRSPEIDPSPSVMGL